MTDKHEKLISEVEKELILKQIEQTIKNHPVTIFTICDWIFVSGIAADYGYKPLNLLKMIEDKKIIIDKWGE